MNLKILLGAAFIAAVGLSVPQARAQGVIGGAAQGADEGAHAAGPIGGLVGGVMGGVAGGVAGLLGIDDQPRFREYVVHERVPDYRWGGRVRVGVVLPAEGVTYYEVPERYHVRGYRYTVVNGDVVLVNPRTRRIVQVIRR